MDKFKDKLKVQSPSSTKEDIKISYVVKIVKVTGLPKANYSPLLISWKRGSKKENTGEVKTIPRDGEGVVDHTINLNATITKTPKGFMEKAILFTIKEEKLGKKPVVLGSVNVNLAQYAESKTEKTHPFPIQDKSKVVCNLYLSIQSSWLKVNGKSMVKAEGNQKEILQELGKQKISHEGTDYFLQTEQDMSEPDQTDFGHDSDNDDEEHVEFDEDSHDKSNVSTLSRKSSSGSIEKGESSSGLNGHNRTNSSNSVGSTTTTTTTSNTSNYVPPPLIKEESEEKDLNAMTADLKIKKYKKQLKTLKSELEKSKSQFASLSKDRDEKVVEIKRMIDDMENIKDRSKTVGNGVISDYTNQIEQLNNKLTTSNKDIENLKIQLQRERNQSSQDSNQVTVLQNQLLTINSQLDTIRNENTTLNNQIRQLETQLRESSSNKPEELQNALATVQNLHLELNQLRGQLATTTEENRSQFIQLEQERLKSNSTESNVNRVEQEKVNLQQRLEHYERTIHLQLEDFEKEKLKISAEVGDLKSKLSNYEQIENELNQLKSKQPEQPEQQDNKELLEARDEIVQLKDKLTAKDSLFKSIEDELVEVKDKLTIKETALIELGDQLEQLKKQQLESKDDSKELIEARDEIVQLKDKLTVKEESIKDIENQLALKDQSFKDTENKLEDRAIEISELREKLAEKESTLTDTQDQLEQLKQSIENQSSTTPIVMDQQELIEARDEIVQLKDKLTTFEHQSQSQDNELIELKDRLTAKELLFKETEDQLYEKSNEISTLQEKISTLEEKNKDNDRNDHSTSQTINELQLKLKELELNTLDQNQTYEERIEKLESQLKEKQLEVQSLQLEVHNNISEGNSNERLNKLEEEHKELKEKLEKAKNKKRTLKVLVSNYKTNIEQLEQKQSTLESSAIANQDGLSDEIDQMKSKLIHQINENEIITDENNQLKSQVISYQDDSTSKQNIIREYQEMISKLEQEKEDLEKQQKQQKGNDDDSDDDRSAEIDEFKEKIQYQKEKIKALKEDLEAKSDEWIDIKIKMEEIISGKQDEIEKLQQLQQESLRSLAVPVSMAYDNQSNQHLEEEINQLKSQIKQLQQENLALSSEKQFKVQHLQQELEQLKQINSASASPRSSIGGGSGFDQNLDELRKEMEENKNIESSIYWSELDFDRNNVPFCGTSVWAIIDGIGGLGKSQNIRLLNKIVISLEKSFLRSGNDCKFIAYWFSTCCYLLSKCHQAGYTQESANPMKTGIEINVNSFVTPAPEIGGSFIRDLQALNLSIYSKLLSVTEIKLEKVLIPSIYLPDSIILEAQKSPIKSSSSTSPLGRTSGSLPTSGNSINNLLYILDGIITFLKEGRIFDSVSNQFLNQIFYFMNAQVTNHLLNNPKVCTTTQGLEVKMGVSRLKEWCSATPYKSASQQLDSSLEASNLLVIDKNVFVDIEAIKSIFQKLNLHQIKQLLQSFTPDSLSPDTLPTVLRKAIDSNWRQSIDIDSLPLLIDQSKKFKV
ncbi:hypothetical protein RB653_009764 [Dictyostelium firmibasis]|uniref:C2 NT-type domain-containing protein n=1 Tax=Dictyostelium firmibasis TaxID=79012 RepID=A0AAN7TQZ4_9MYCE